MTPDWIREARETYVLRARDWAAQTWACTLHPHRFASEWASGTRETLNPLRFFAFGLGVQLTAAWIAKKVSPNLASIEPAVEWLRGALGRQLVVLVLACLVHPLLRFRSGRPLRATIGAIAFAFAGPATLFTVVAYPVGAVLAARGHPTLAPLVAATYLRAGWTSAAIAGAHQRSRAWTIVVLALFFGVAFGLEHLGRLLVALDRT